jgi:hypothetical protein
MSIQKKDDDEEALIRFSLDPFANQGTKLKEQVDRFSQAGCTKPAVQHCLGILEAFRDDFDKGFLDAKNSLQALTFSLN